MARIEVNHSKIYIAPSQIPGAEYGVYSRVPLRKDELIEVAPFVEIPREVIYSLPNRLQDYVFKSHLNPKNALVILGYGSMYNHRPRPNVKYVPYPKDPRRFIGFYMLKDVPADTELFVHYGRDPITFTPCKPILD